MADKAKKTIKTKDVSVVNAKGKTTPTRKKASKKTTAVAKDKKEVSKKSTVSSAEPVVKEAVETKQPEKASPVKKSEPVADKKTKTAAVKATKTSSTTKVKEVKAEPVKAEPAKEVKEKPAKKPAKKAAAKKEPAKKAEKKTVKKEPAKKTTKKKAETKKADDLREEKMKQYQAFSVETCIDMANAMGIKKNYDDYAKLLLEEADENKIAEKVIAEAKVKAADFDYEKDGYDLDLIPVLVARISATVDLKASDFANMKEMVAEVTKAKEAEDKAVDNETYNNLLDTVRKVLMIAQRKNLHKLEDTDNLLNISTKELVVSYMDAAYSVLANWQYSDVKFYEGFIYSVLSQFEELHQELGNRAMMDVADLYILHGDYSRADADYHYIIRENSIKDYIFYRYAHIYEAIDRDKARAIAEESRQFVDERFDYYEAIKKILEN